MPKMKPHKSSRRRFAISANGKVRFKSPGGGHLMSGKSGKRKRHLRQLVNITGKKLFNYVRELGIEGKWRRANERAQLALRSEAAEGPSGASESVAGNARSGASQSPERSGASRSPDNRRSGASQSPTAERSGASHYEGKGSARKEKPDAKN